MSDDSAKGHLKEGFSHMFKAAQKAAGGLRRTNIGKALDDAGREVARAATNVADRIGSQVTKVVGRESSTDKTRIATDEPERSADPAADPRGGEAEGGASHNHKPTGPTDDDPGFWIAKEDTPPKP